MALYFVLAVVLFTLWVFRCISVTKKLTNTSKRKRSGLFQRLLQLMIQRPCWESLRLKCRHSWVDKPWLSWAPSFASKGQWPEDSAAHAKPHQLEITYKAVWSSSQSLPSGTEQMLTWVGNGATLKTLNMGLSHRFRGMHRKGSHLVPELFVMPGQCLVNWVNESKL